MKRQAFLTACVAVSLTAGAYHLLPPPKVMDLTGGSVSSRLPVAVRLVDSIAGAYDYPLAGYPNEAYRIAVGPDSVRVEAVTPTGVIRAEQTLAQMREERPDSLPVGVITDWPAFKLRGYMHDSGRSYVPVDMLVRHIELLSRFKVNTFHWHLTENQAWRLHIDSHPELTADSAMTRHRGQYYTREDVRRVMEAANRCGVVVIPEIDMPGHSAAFERATGLDMQSEEGMAVLRDVLREVADMFAESPYIHIGADEKQIHNPDFLPSMTEFVHSLGKRVVCWNPIHGVKIDPSLGFDMTQMWSTAGKAVKGIPNIDCRYNYTNHFDVFADLVGIYKSNIYYRDRGDAEIAGTISAPWNDRLLPTADDIVRQNNFYANVLASAERAWKGGGERYIEQGGVTLPSEGPEYEEFSDFERRLLYHKDHTLSGEPIPYVRQSDVRWLVTGPDGRQHTATGAGVYLRHTWGDIVPALLDSARLGQTASAMTYVWSDKDQDCGALIEFQNYSRSERDVAPEAGRWDRKGSRVFLNGKEIMAPDWRNAGIASVDHELPLADENFTARRPVKVHLRKGWNRVDLYLPYAQSPGVRLNKWMFTFVLTDSDGRNALPGIIYDPHADLSSEPRRRHIEN